MSFPEPEGQRGSQGLCWARLWGQHDGHRPTAARGAGGQPELATPGPGDTRPPWPRLTLEPTGAFS